MYNTVFHFVVAVDDCRSIVYHYVVIFVGYFVVYTKIAVVHIPFCKSSFAELRCTVIALDNMCAGNDVCHRIAQVFHKRRGYSRPNGLISLFCRVVDAILFLHVFLHRRVVGQKQGVLSVGREQSQQIGAFEYICKVRILVAAVEQKVGYSLTGEGEAVALVNLVCAG